MGDIMTKRARLRALQDLLEYAGAEAQELAMTRLRELLSAASGVVEDKLREGRDRTAVASSSGKVTRIRLVAGTDGPWKKGNGTG